jgi:hypothetical protein
VVKHSEAQEDKKTTKTNPKPKNDGKGTPNK